MSNSYRSRLYVIPVLSKALDVLELMQKENTPRTLEEIYQRTNISKTTVYRILKTLGAFGEWAVSTGVQAKESPVWLRR